MTQESDNDNPLSELQLQAIAEELADGADLSMTPPTFVTDAAWPDPLSADESAAELAKLLDLLAQDDGDGTMVTTIDPQALEGPVEAADAERVMRAFQTTPPANDSLIFED